MRDIFSLLFWWLTVYDFIYKFVWPREYEAARIQAGNELREAMERVKNGDGTRVIISSDGVYVDNETSCEVHQ